MFVLSCHCTSASDCLSEINYYNVERDVKFYTHTLDLDSPSATD